jgi:hypothetical protein
VLIGLVIQQAHFHFCVGGLELLLHCEDFWYGLGFYPSLERLDMPKRDRIPTPMKASKATSVDSDELVTVALFSGMGLLLSLVAIILRMRGIGF